MSKRGKESFCRVRPRLVIFFLFDPSLFFRSLLSIWFSNNFTRGETCYLQRVARACLPLKKSGTNAATTGSRLVEAREGARRKRRRRRRENQRRSIVDRRCCRRRPLSSVLRLVFFLLFFLFLCERQRHERKRGQDWHRIPLLRLSRDRNRQDGPGRRRSKRDWRRGELCLRCSRAHGSGGDDNITSSSSGGFLACCPLTGRVSALAAPSRDSDDQAYQGADPGRRERERGFSSSVLSLYPSKRPSETTFSHSF